MALKKIRPGTVSMLLSSLFLIAIGSYTGNGGFQLGGGIFLLVGLIVAFNQAQGRSDDQT